MSGKINTYVNESNIIELLNNWKKENDDLRLENQRLCDVSKGNSNLSKGIHDSYIDNLQKTNETLLKQINKLKYELEQKTYEYDELKRKVKNFCYEFDGIF